MTWLKFLTLLIELVLQVTKTLEDQKLVRQSEIEGAKKAMELTRERLQDAQRARAASPDAVVRDGDKDFRD